MRATLERLAYITPSAFVRFPPTALDHQRDRNRNNGYKQARLSVGQQVQQVRESAQVHHLSFL